MACWAMGMVSSRMQQRLQLLHGVAKLVRAAEFADDFGHIAVLGNRRGFHHFGQGELQFAVGGVFFQQVIQDLACFRGKTAEKGLSL